MLLVFFYFSIAFVQTWITFSNILLPITPVLPKISSKFVQPKGRSIYLTNYCLYVKQCDLLEETVDKLQDDVFLEQLQVEGNVLWI